MEYTVLIQLVHIAKQYLMHVIFICFLLICPKFMDEGSICIEYAHPLMSLGKGKGLITNFGSPWVESTLPPYAHYQEPLLIHPPV